MSGDYLSRIHGLVRRRKGIVIGLLGVVIAVSLIGLKYVKYNNNIELMLPQNATVLSTMRFLREANFSDKLVISLRLNDELRATQDLILASDRLAASIKTSPMVKQVISNVLAGDVASEMVSFLKYTPQLLGPESISKIESQISPGAVKERLKFIYRQSLSPGSSFLTPFLRADPFGLSSGILRNIEKLSTQSGYEVVINNGHLISKDGRHAMVIVKTPVSLTEGFGSRKLITYLQGELKAGLPGFVSADIIAGHMHTVSNEDVIINDIRLTSIICLFVFLLLFLFFFRDLRAVIIFLAPLAAVAISINITYFVFKNLSYSVIGMGTVISGIAIDYGIYVYMAVRKAGGSQHTIRRVIRPVIFSALTTISVFTVFFFSNVKGYHQLAFFSTSSIILCLVFSLFILPHFLIREKKSGSTFAVFNYTLPPEYKVRDSLRVFCWVAILAVMFISGTGLRFNNDITQFDGVAKEVVSAEDRFHNAWGGKVLPAVFVSSGKTLEGTYQSNTDIYEAVIKNIGKDRFTSLASVWPGLNTRKANALRWQEFWSPELEAKLKNMLADLGQAYNFSAGAFKPFFQNLRPAGDLEVEPKGFSFFEHLKEQYVIKKEGEYQVLSFFPDQDEYISRLSAISKDHPGTFIVSRKNFSNTVSRALGKELAFLALLAVFLTVALTFLLLRDIRLSVIALVPVITSIVMIAGVLPLAGLALNMSSIIASMIVVALVSDYGMFVAYYCKHKFQTGTYPAVTFAAATTIIGAGALLFARHPILFSVGVALVTGVLSGYLSSLIIIPPLYRLWIPEKGLYKMKRYHLCEIADRLWFPATLRNFITDVIEFTVVKFKIYEPVIPLIKEVMRHMKTTRIIDLCSGSSGPWSQIQEQLQKEQGPVCVTLTDKYPNIRAFEKIKERSGNKIQYMPGSVDATNVPDHLKGIRTIFSAFHHFEPDMARKILQNTVNSHSAIGIFDFTEKRLDKIAFAFLLPLFVLFITPFIRPKTFKRVFWVNIIPIIPWVLTYDAIVSSFTTYSPEDLQELVKGINSQGYVWKMGRVASKLRSVRVTYLIGFPKDLHYA